MVLKALILLGVNGVTLAGFDGFSEQNMENYYDEYMDFFADYEQLKMVNKTVKESEQAFRSQINIEFLTESCYEK